MSCYEPCRASNGENFQQRRVQNGFTNKLNLKGNTIEDDGEPMKPSMSRDLEMMSYNGAVSHETIT